MNKNKIVLMSGKSLCRILALAFSVCLWFTLVSLSPVPKHTPSNYEDRIRAHFRAHRWSEGGAVLDSALLDYPSVGAFCELKGQHILHDIEAGTGTMKKMGRQKSYELARYYLIKSIELDEKNLNSRRLLLRVETETQHYSSAIVYCNELLEQNPYNEHLWRTKIDLYRKLGNDMEADRLLERLQTIYPESQTLRKDLAYRKTEQVRKLRDKGDVRGMEESLRQLIELEPGNAEHYEQLFSLLYRTGRLEEAADLAERAVQSKISDAARSNFIAKRVSVLMEMNRHTEAMNYLNSKNLTSRSASLQRLKNELDIERARMARMNDPYEAYANVYDKQHLQEALDYLIGTSIQRGYHDDAIYYIREARKHHDTPKLQYQEYLVLKRMGYKNKAVAILRDLYETVPGDTDVAVELAEIYLADAATLIVQGQYDEAIPLLSYVYAMKADPEITSAARSRLLNCYLQTHNYEMAEALLIDSEKDLEGSRYCTQKAMILNMMGRKKEALTLLANEYRALPDTEAQLKKNISYTYEEIAVPYIKGLVANGMTHVAWQQVREALEISPDSYDILHYAISLSLAQHKDEQAQEYARRGIEKFPNDPYFKLKNAQLLIQEKDYKTSIDSLRALLDVYPGDTTIVLAFTDCSENLALKYMKDHEYRKSIQVLDTALYFNPNSHTLLYTKSLVYQKMKDWNMAERSLKGYKPDFRELSAYNRRLEEIANQQMLNNLTLEYQKARLGSEDAMSANAYASYTRKVPWQTRAGEKRMDALTVGMAYAGRDGVAQDPNAVELTKGGTGIQLSAAWEHQFCSRFTAKAEAAWSNRYFPTIVANLSGAYDLKNQWQLMARASFRWLKTYTGIWHMQNEFAGYDPDGKPLYANVMKQTGWHIKNRPMFQVGLGVGKTLGVEDRFHLSAGLDGFLLAGNFYFNGNAKMQFFPFMDHKTFVYAQGGLGTAPESSLIDQSLAVGFSDLNTFVSMGGQYFINRYVSLGLSGSWYTLLTHKETLSIPLHDGTTASTTNNYTNYFYVHLSVILTF